MKVKKEEMGECEKTGRGEGKKGRGYDICIYLYR